MALPEIIIAITGRQRENRRKGGAEQRALPCGSRRRFPGQSRIKPRRIPSNGSIQILKLATKRSSTCGTGVKARSVFSTFTQAAGWL